MPWKDPAKRRDYMRKYHKEWYHRNLDKCRAQARGYAKKAQHHVIDRIKFLEEFGNRCSCCGEAHKEFLSMEHVQGGGGKCRRTCGKQYSKARIEGYPRDKYDCLCHNCNQSKGIYGYCPHERERQAIALIPEAPS